MKKILPVCLGILMFAGCTSPSKLPASAGFGADPELPSPHVELIPVVDISSATGWAPGAAPTPAAGLKVERFAENLDHPRWLYTLPNGDVLVAETNAPPKPEDSKGIAGWIRRLVMKRAGAGGVSANRITLLRDSNADGVADSRFVFLDGLHSPFGMALVGNTFYVADTDALLSFPYQTGETHISAAPHKIADLPAGLINHHWTKNVIASADGRKLYVAVGSNSNVGENGMAVEAGRAAIWEVDPKTGSHRIFASGLRNPNGLAWDTASGQLWTAVNERDEIGNDLVPDYITSLKDGGFYGWPWSYYGQHVDPRPKPSEPDKIASAIVPDYAVGSHTASLGLLAAKGNSLPAQFTDGMFVGQHGSWNREPKSGYKVIFVPFAQGKPSGLPIDVLTGFLSADGDAQGRPVGLALDGSGALLVADDVGNVVWRVSNAGAPARGMAANSNAFPAP